MASTRNLLKETVTADQLDVAPWPAPGVVLQVRVGQVKPSALGGEVASAIYKKEQDRPVFCTKTGLVGDEHAYKEHGGFDRAVHQYNPDHYPSWRAEKSPAPELYEPGAYGENLVTTGLSEENVCIGDVFRVGSDVLLEVSEPRHPCHKINQRFQWERGLVRTIKTGRAGWNYRVLQTGYVCKGDPIVLVKRPFPRWSVLDVQRVIRARHVPFALLAECARLPTTPTFVGLATGRLRESPKKYKLVDARLVTPRVRQLTFELQGGFDFAHVQFDPYAFAQITFGPESAPISRSYSIVDGNLLRFTLGVALDRQSRGGSAYLHRELKVGDEIEMAPGANPRAVENDSRCDESLPRILVVGGIGITAFLPSISLWEDMRLPYHVHYAVKSPEEAAFLDRLPASKTTLYASSRGERLDLDKIIPKPEPHGGPDPPARIFSCGPAGMMKECARVTSALGYPEHMVHFEDFGGGGAGGGLGEAFEVEVEDPDESRRTDLAVPSNKSLLDVLNEAGFDIAFSCKVGGCGACKVKVCHGEVDYKSSALLEKEKGRALQACVDRGRGKLKLELI
ncbi:hypothetical protein RB595_004941 [Gaeumannomyces hyphopodioides]